MIVSDQDRLVYVFELVSELPVEPDCGCVETFCVQGES